MNAIIRISARTVISRTVLRTVLNHAAENIQQAGFPPQRGLTRLHHSPSLSSSSSAVPPLLLRLQYGACVFKQGGQRRCLASTAPPSSDKLPVSPHIGFYQMFGRPLAKVFLVAMGTYQALYWTWLKLEAVEEEREKKEEIDRLEKRLEEVRPKVA